MNDAKLPEAYAEHCDKVSLADFLVIAAEAVMGRTARDYDAKDPFKEDTVMDTFRDNFLAGRETAVTCPWSYGRMPDAERGLDAMRDLFHDEIYHQTSYAWRMTTALMGAHTLGGASK